MTHRWATHQGLPALRRSQTQRVIVCPEAPAGIAGLNEVICVFSWVLHNCSPSGGLGSTRLPESLRREEN